MMKKVDDLVKSEEAFKNTKLPKGEFQEKGAVTQFRGSRPPRHSYRNGLPRTDNHHRRDHYQPYVSPRGPDRKYDNRRHNFRRREVLRIPWRKGELYKRLLSLEEAIRNCLGIQETQPSGQGCATKGNNHGKHMGNNNKG
ncbi:hypothetical protein Tco_0048201 [Tanacetum coccineum]